MIPVAVNSIMPLIIILPTRVISSTCFDSNLKKELCVYRLKYDFCLLRKINNLVSAVHIKGTLIQI